MRKLFAILALIGSFQVATSATITIGDDGYYYDGAYYDYDEDNWAGPGWYYGFWFGSENEFWGWRRNHPNWWHHHHNHHWYHHDHHRGWGHHHHGGGHRHGGGHHHGGHHGGGHHR